MGHKANWYVTGREQGFWLRQTQMWHNVHLSTALHAPPSDSCSSGTEFNNRAFNSPLWQNSQADFGCRTVGLYALFKLQVPLAVCKFPVASRLSFDQVA